jgi:putative FmdB family regulatory protein
VPIYEYRCLKNGHIFEVLQTVNDKPVKNCEICKSPVEKLVSSAAFHLKGSGWYATDYKNNSKPAEKVSKAVTSTPEASAAGSGTSKPEGSPKSQKKEMK